MQEGLLVGGNGQQQVTMHMALTNRHGLIAGATGTGKTVSLQVLAEGFARAGVPVLVADIKGDLSGLAAPARPSAKITERVAHIGMTDYAARAFHCVFWDVFGKRGHPLRTTISEFGPLLLAEFLQLNETQTAVLYAAFAVADKEGLLLLDIKDLQALLQLLKEQRAALSDSYGGISEASIAAIVRRLMLLEQQGGTHFFGEPALDLNHLMHISADGSGTINILCADELVQQPRLYALTVLWLMAELFENLPERGDAERPKFVIFFDEAHLLFDNASSVLLEKVEQVVRLIRSKGVGIYFVSQHPTDIPEAILGQLGHRVQHALRAFTPKDQKAVKISAATFRPNPRFSTETAITELATGEALVSVLDAKGTPTLVERIMVAPPQSQIGALSEEVRAHILAQSPLGAIYGRSIDRDSAYEVLKQRVQAQQHQRDSEAASNSGTANRNTASRNKDDEQDAPAKAPRSRRQSPLEAFATSTLRSVGSNLGRQIARGILGALTGKK